MPSEAYMPMTVLEIDFGVSYMDPTFVSLHTGCWSMRVMCGADVALTFERPTPDSTQSLRVNVSGLIFFFVPSVVTFIVMSPVVLSPSAFVAKSL